MGDADFDWAAAVMERRRQRYAEYSPVFWRPATDVTAGHAQFMRALAGRDGGFAIRSDDGFVLSYPQGGRCFVDDFAVTADHLWASQGRDLLLALWSTARSPDQTVLRVVTARRDEAKRSMLTALGLEVAARWWVKEVSPVTEPTAWGPVTLGGVEAVIAPAPPVYDPGGPVCLLGDLDPSLADDAVRVAAELGAVLAIVQYESDPSDHVPGLEAAGFHNPSEHYDGDPIRHADTEA